MQIFLLAVSLALDALAVSVSAGISTPHFTWRHAVKLGLWFGVFQFAMPVVGYFLGTGVADYIVAVDHWIAFGLLGFIGGRMLLGGLRPAEGDGGPPPDLSPGRLTLLAIATSIDALAVGVSMAFLSVDIWRDAAIIGAVAFALSLVGGLAGRRLGDLFQRWAQAAGGLTLIAIGVKLLVEHLA